MLVRQFWTVFCVGKLNIQVKTLNHPFFLDNPAAAQGLSGKETDDHEKAGAMAFQAGETRALLDGFLEIIVKSVGAIAGAVRVFSPDGKALQIAGSVSLPPEFMICEEQVHLGCGICGQAATAGKLHNSDAADCAHLSGSVFFQSHCARVIAIPLEFRGKRIGVFNLFFASGREISADVEQTLRPYADLIGISLENARLVKENRRMSLMAERQAIANEIHDSLAQTLTFARMRTSVMQEALRKQDQALAQKCLDDVNGALDSGKKSVRELITHFRCQMDPLGLEHALQQLAAEFCGRTGIALDYSIRVADFSMPLEHESQVFHIVREVLSNIAVHSGAKRASLSVTRENGRYVFVIEDNGAGISGGPSQEGHYGLTIMHERAGRIGAEIAVTSAEGQGTRVCLSIAALAGD